MNAGFSPRSPGEGLRLNINAVPPGAGFDPKYIDPRLAGNNFAGPVTASNPGPLPGTRLVDANLMRPYQGFNTLTQINNVGNNRYNSLQTNLGFGSANITSVLDPRRIEIGMRFKF